MQTAALMKSRLDFIFKVKDVSGNLSRILPFLIPFLRLLLRPNFLCIIGALELCYKRTNCNHRTLMLLIYLLLIRWWQVPYFWAGIKMYDLVSGSQILKSSYFLNKSRSLELFPHLKKDKLKGSIVYYDGAFLFCSLGAAVVAMQFSSYPSDKFIFACWSFIRTVWTL